MGSPLTPKVPPEGATQLPWALAASFLNFFFLNDYLLLTDRERQNLSRGGAERGRDTESEAGSRLQAVNPEPDAGLELTDHEVVT